MLLHVLAAIHNTTTLLFGIFLSAFFLGVRQNKSNTIKLLLYSLAEGTVYLLSLTLIGETATMQIYPLFIHLPLALFLTFYYHYTFLSSCVSIVSAVRSVRGSECLHFLSPVKNGVITAFASSQPSVRISSYAAMCVTRQK